MKINNIWIQTLFTIATKFIGKGLLIVNSGWSRLLIFVVFLLVLARLLLSFVWVPLQLELVLPPGVLEDTPEFKFEIWEEIKANRDARINFQEKNWDDRGSIFLIRQEKKR